MAEDLGKQMYCPTCRRDIYVSRFDLNDEDAYSCPVCSTSLNEKS